MNEIVKAEVTALLIEIERLQKALAFWLPHRVPDMSPALDERLEHDIGLLTGYEGKMEPDAIELGWIELMPQIEEVKP